MQQKNRQKYLLFITDANIFFIFLFFYCTKGRKWDSKISILAFCSSRKRECIAGIWSCWKLSFGKILGNRRFWDADGDRKSKSTDSGALWPRPISWKPFFYLFKLNATDEKSVASAKEKNSQLPAAVRVSKTSMLKFSDDSQSEHFVPQMNRS